VVVRSLHLVSSTARRGAQTFAVDLVAALQQRGEQATVVALHGDPGDATYAVLELGRSRRAASTLRALRRAAASADVVVAHGSSTLEASTLALAGSGVPFVYRTIGDPSYWVSSATRRRGVGLMLRRAARHVVLWEGAAHQLATTYGIDPGRIDVIPNAVRADRFQLATDRRRRAARGALQVPEGQLCLAYVGALSVEKAVGVAIEAAGSLDAVLLIAGEGRERVALDAQASRGRGDVRFLGPVEDPADIYAAADLLLLPSLSEGMPAVIIEAGLVGTPAVASAVGSVPDLIDHARTGFLVPPGDTAALLAVIDVARRSSREVGHAAAARFRAAYDIHPVAEGWLDTLERAIGS
jgi:glycosyltransferase involved in cell wall biosynthesis